MVDGRGHLFCFKERNHLKLLNADIEEGVRRGRGGRNRRRGKVKAKEAPWMVGEAEGWNSGHGVEGGLALAALPRRAAGRGAQSALRPGTEQCWMSTCHSGQPSTAPWPSPPRGWTFASSFLRLPNPNTTAHPPATFKDCFFPQQKTN